MMSVASVHGLTPAELLGALEGRAGHDAIRAIVTDPLRHGLAELLDSGEPGRSTRSLRLLRSKYKPGRKLTGYYAVAGEVGPATRHAAVSWGVDGSVTLLMSPTDPAMPQVARLADPLTLARLVEQLSGTVPSTGDPSVTTVRYRPGQRHVLHARSPGRGSFYVKVDRDASGAHAVPVARALQELLLQDPSGVRVAEPVGYSAAEQAALWWEAPGASLASTAATQAHAADVVAQLGRAVRVVHERWTASDGDPTLAALGRHSVEAEAAATLRAGEHIAALLPAVGTTYADIVAGVVERLDSLPAEEATLIHGDLKADNVLVHRDQLYTLDLDRACWADPALDLGKLLADLRWWSRSAQDPSGAESALRAGYGPCPARWARAEALASLFQAKYAARRCLVHDPRWPDRVREQVTAAAASLRFVRRR